ncbi:hypothetical protein R3P38DRAFT_3240650 [Favolaschia claudopus]|uniref:F-box domain-containing protein n=1 Tax=Favolaschia claudopus TaxID=2862362 RepID=A0AAV9Z6G6_9AGAR
MYSEDRSCRFFIEFPYDPKTSNPFGAAVKGSRDSRRGVQTRSSPPTAARQTFPHATSRGGPLRWDLLTDLEVKTDPWEPALHVVVVSSASELRDAPVELLHLDALELSIGSGRSSFLKKLYVPNLSKFVIRGNTQDSLPQFSSSSISLESLDIEGPHYSKTSRLEVLRAVSTTMRHLIIRDCFGSSVARFLDGGFMEMLTPAFHSSTSRCCCPSLESLTVACLHGISDWAIERFVVRRTSTTDLSAPSLKRVRSQFNRLMKLDIIPNLKSFMDAGLEVEMMYSILRRTNYCPLDDEVLEIRSLLAEPTRLLLVLDEEISQLQKSIEKLTEKRQTLSGYIEEHKALISPIRRIPQDVLAEIFFACLPTHRNCVMTTSEAPVLLGRICSSWRALSLATPRLWASLHVVQPGGSGASNDTTTQRFETMKLWLGRSGQCPLSISVYTSYTHLFPEEPMPTQAQPLPIDLFLKELSFHAKRWQHVSFSTTSDAFEALAHLSAADVPILESITVRLPPPFPPHDVTEWTQFGMFAGPRISKFLTSASCFSPSIPLRWHLLTNLDIVGSIWESRVDSEEALEVLIRCPQLQRFKLTVKETADPVPSGYPPVELPHLHSLELDVGPHSHLLSHLRAPELRKFVLRGPVESLPSFLSLCPHLERLDVGSYPTKSSLLESLRVLSPALRSLAFRGHAPPPENTALNVPRVPFDDDALAALGRRSCCPLLEEFTLMATHTISDRALQQFVETRMAMTDEVGASSLKQVRVLFSRPMDLDIKTGLKPFLDAGLDIETVYTIKSQASFSPWLGVADAPRHSLVPVYHAAPSHWYD